MSRHTATHRLIIVGPMPGKHPGFNPTVGEILAMLFAQEGQPTIATSGIRNRAARIIDMLVTLALRGRRNCIQILQLYSGNSFLYADLASLLGRLFGQRVVMHLHGGALPEFIKRYPWWAGRVLKRADVLVSPSRYLARSFGDAGYATRIIPNPIEFERYPYRLRSRLSPRFLWLRAFHEIYNPEMAVRTLKHLLPRYPGAMLVMAGQDKGLEASLKKLVSDLGLSSHVSFPGSLGWDAKLHALAEADIFLNTARIDNTPVSVLEACACGLPVVSTWVGGIPDLLSHEETAMLVPPEDYEEMAEAACRLLEDPDVASRLSAAGHAMARLSSWDIVHNQWKEVFQWVGQHA